MRASIPYRRPAFDLQLSKIKSGAMTPIDKLHLNTSAGFLQIVEPIDAWIELERILPLNRVKTEVPSVHLAQLFPDHDG